MTTTAGGHLALRAAAEDFLYQEADLLDEWRLLEWLELFALEGTYVLPTTDLPDGDPTRDLMLVHDDRFLIEQRVRSLLTRAAHAEFPHSRTRRQITNVRIRDVADGFAEITANFAVHRIRYNTMHTYIGRYRHLVGTGGPYGFLFHERRATLDLETLSPHGKVSIII